MFDKLMNEYDGQIPIKEENMPKGLPGLFINGTIYIDKNIPTIAKGCILIEEIMHWKYTSGDIINQSKISNAKQEVFARRRGYETLIPLENIIDCFYLGLREYFEVAEYLNVTETFLCHTVNYYKEKYGPMYPYKRYFINFGNTIDVYRRF